MKQTKNFKMKNTITSNASKAHEEIFPINTISKNLSDSKRACQNDISKEPAWKCRYAVTLIAFLILLLTSIHSTVMSIVIVAMVNNTAINQNATEKSESCRHLIRNSSEYSTLDSIKSEGEFLWSAKIQGYILGSFFFGNVMALMPGSRLAERYGWKSITVGTLLTLSILTMLIPPFAWFSASAVIVIQMLRGLTQCMPTVCMSILIANWSPRTERGILFSIIQAAHYLGPGIGTIFAGYISESPGGWPYAFYIVGGLGLTLAVYVLFFVAENPKEHTSISKAELDFILSQQESKLERRRPKLPWRQLLTSMPLYALIAATIGRYWGFSQFVTVHSIFLGTILHYPIAQNGLFSAIPHFLAFVASMSVTWISGYVEKKKLVSVDFLRKFLVVTSGVLFSLCLFGMYMAGCNRDLSVTFSILSVGAGAVGTPGFSPFIYDMSPTFAGTLFSISCTIGYMACVLLPLLAGYLTNGMQTIEQWNKLFLISIGIVMSTKLIFFVFGSTEIQSWNFVEDEKEKKEEKQPESERKKEATRF